MGRFSRRKPAITADVYRVVLTLKDGTEKRSDRILRPEEVNDYVGGYNRFTKLTGITAMAIPCHVVEIDDILPASAVLRPTGFESAAVMAKGGAV